MSKKKLLQMGVIAAIAAILVIPTSTFVIGQVLEDTTPPSVAITEPADGANLNITNVIVNGTASDASGIASVEVFVDNISQGNSTLSGTLWTLTLTLTEGAHNVTAKATDTAGNMNSASINLTIDITPPSITAPATITVEGNSAGGATGVALGTPTVSDNIDPSPSVSNNAPLLFPLGSTAVIWTATDDSGNSATAVQSVTVVDTTAPSVTAPPAITVEADTAGGVSSSNAAIVAFLSGATASDIVDPIPTIANNAPSLFPLGTTTVTFTAADDSGNSASATSTVTVVDTTLPSITITAPTNGTKFNTTSVTVNGTVSDNNTIASVEMLVDNISQGNATVINGSWTKSLTLAEGTHNITAKATDASGNMASTSIIIIIDTTPPTINISSPANGANINTNNVNIAGTASDAIGILSVKVSIDSGAFLAANGTTSWSFAATLVDGTHSITAQATDMAGNTKTTSITVVIDTGAPIVAVTSPTNGAKINSANVTIAGTASSSISQIQSITVSIDNAPSLSASFNATSGIWTLGPVTLTDGNHTAKATATDTANNTAMASVSFIVDTTLPQIAITSPANGAALNTSNVTITGTASDLNGILSVKISIDSGAFALANGTTSWSFKTVLTVGNHTITAKATDMAGNTKMTSISILVDIDAPTIAITSPVNGAKIISANVTISGTANGGLSSIASVKVSIDAGTASPASFNSTTGAWTFGPVTLADGNHTAKATATDIANNTAMASVSFIVDTIPPNVAITSPSNGSTLNSTSVNISGTASDANGVTSVKVSIDSGSFMLANGTTSWSFHTTLTTGNHTITAKATDMAGNMKNATISIKIKTPPPVVSELGVFSCEGKSIRGNLIIDDLDVTFINCEVRGNIRISNSNIFAEDSNIRGNFVLTDSDVEIKESEIRGNFRINGGSLILTDNTIRGQVKVCGTDVIEISDNTYKGGIKFCSEGEGWEDDYEEGKYSNVQSGSNQGSKDNGKGKGKSDQTSGSSGKGGKDEGKSDNDKGKHGDKEKVKGNDGSKSNSNGNGKGNSGEKGNSGKGSDNGNKGNSGKSNGGNGGGNGKGKGKN